MDSDGLLTLVSIVYSQDELAILCSRLAAENIPVLRHDAGLVSACAPLTWAMGGVRLFVPVQDGERARALLAAAPRWSRTGGVFARNRVLDLSLALLLGMFMLCPPARIGAVLIGGRQEISAA